MALYDDLRALVDGNHETNQVNRYIEMSTEQMLRLADRGVEEYTINTKGMPESMRDAMKAALEAEGLTVGVLGGGNGLKCEWPAP